MACCSPAVWTRRLFRHYQNSPPVASKDQERSEARWPQLKFFCGRSEGSPDLEGGPEVANHLGTVHHEIHFTVQEGLDAIRDVIYRH